MPAIHGPHHYRASLTESDVRRVRADYEPGRVTYAALAARYGVSEQAIGKIINRLTWRHLD